MQRVVNAFLNNSFIFLLLNLFDTFYNGTNTYQNIYYLNVSQTPSLSFVYYDVWDVENEFPIARMTTTMTYSNLNTSVAGYYYRTYTATDGLFYSITFRIVFQVGTPPATVTTPQNHIHYNYNTNWEDQLYNYGSILYVNGVAQPMVVQQQYSSYDAMGNPTYITNFVYNGTTYYGASLGWSGRQLNSITIMSSGSTPAYQIRYKYNDQGYRTQKQLYTFSNYVPTLTSTITYELNGDKVIYETNGTYGILFMYDYDGTLIGFNYDSNITDQSNGFDYFYLRNQLGDITHIVDITGTTIVKYSYDAYGNITYQTPSQSIGNINPYRYRGYRYDSEIKMYYLTSRYYNPTTGRFISSDGLLGQVGNVLSTNMYAYCANNPVLYIDPDGDSFFVGLLIAGIVGGLAGLFGQMISDSITSSITHTDYRSSQETYIGAFIGGAVGGILLAFGVGGVFSGFVSGFATGALTTGFGYGLEMAHGKREYSLSFLLTSMLTDGIIGGILGEMLYFPSINAGSHSFLQVYKAGITKVVRYGFNMSAKVILKGLAFNLFNGVGLDIYYGIKQRKIQEDNYQKIIIDPYPIFIM